MPSLVSARKGNNRCNVYFEARARECFGEEEKLFAAFLDLEKANDQVPRELVYWCMRGKGIPKKLVRIVNDTYEKVTTRVGIPFGETVD